MRACRPSWAVYRAAIAVVALYALVLQALLGGVSIAASADLAHVLCLQKAGTEDGSDKPSQAHGHLPCCTAAQLPDVATPMTPVVLVIVWPRREPDAVIWRPEVIASPRAPPGVSPSARAPPVA